MNKILSCCGLQPQSRHPSRKASTLSGAIMASQLTYCVCSSSSTPVLGPTWTIVFCVFKHQTTKTMMCAGITNALAFIKSSTLTMTMDYLKPMRNFKKNVNDNPKCWGMKNNMSLNFLGFNVVSSFFAKKQQLTSWKMTMDPIFSHRKSLLSFHGLHYP